MSASAPCPPDSPLMIAWTAYKATEEYPNTKKWAAYPEHVEGSLWAAFMAGFNAQSACISDARNAALEQAAQECEKLLTNYGQRGSGDGPDAARRMCALRIRMLKTPEAPK